RYPDWQFATTSVIDKRQNADSHHGRNRKRFEQQDVVRKARPETVENRKQGGECGRIEWPNARRRGIDQRVTLSCCQCFGKQHVPCVINDQAEHVVEPQVVNRQTKYEPHNSSNDQDHLPLLEIVGCFLRWNEGLFWD